MYMNKIIQPRSNKQQKGKPFTIKQSATQKAKNNCLESIGTDICLKTIKKEKKINRENIFIKKKVIK